MLAALAMASPQAQARLRLPTPGTTVALTLATPAVDFATTKVPTSATAVLERRILRNANRYALTVWWEQWGGDVERLANAPTTLKSDDVRRYSSVAYELAVSLATGAYSESVTGVPRDVAERRTRLLVEVLAGAHRANLGVTLDSGWGGGWQTGLWASQAAQAAWLLGETLPAADALMVARMLAFEADATLNRPIHYLRDRHGATLTPGDTGAEELAWDGMLLETAVELLPSHPRRAVWASGAYRRMVGSYARPQDVSSTRVVNGLPLASWLDGSNAETNALVVNHYRLHPDYAACVGFDLAAVTITSLVGDGVPDTAMSEASGVYRALSSVPFRGATIYVRGSSDIRYPWGTDWGTDRQIVFGALDAQVSALGLDRGLSTPARVWAQRHLGAVAAMQSRSATGQTYQPGDDNRYPQREEQIGTMAALSYLTDWVVANRLVKRDTHAPSSKAPAGLTSGGDVPRLR